MKSIHFFMLPLLVGGALTGCATPPAQILDGMEPTAINTALQRGRFELNCPEADAMLLSRELMQPAIEGPRFVGIQRGSFTVGVSGCNQRKTYQIFCPEGGAGCFDGGSLENIR